MDFSRGGKNKFPGLSLDALPDGDPLTYGSSALRKTGRLLVDFDDQGPIGFLPLVFPGFLWLSAVIRSFWVVG